MNMTTNWAIVFTVFALAISTGTSSALDKCKAKIRTKDGTIFVSAKSVSGSLEWGTTLGAEDNAFASPCITDGVAKKCTLGAEGTAARITPPELCTLYLADDVSSCSAFIKKCTPGIRTLSPGSTSATGMFSLNSQSPSGAAPAPLYDVVSGRGDPDVDRTEVAALSPNLDCEAKDLAVETSAAPGAGNTLTVTLQSDATDTSVGCSISDGSTTCNSGGSAEVVPAASQVNFKFEYSGSGPFPLLKIRAGWRCSAAS